MQTTKSLLMTHVFSGSLLIGGCLFLASAPAFAQETVSTAPILIPQQTDQAGGAEDDDEKERREEEVVVTGFRAAIEDAIANKRNADTIIESISAEDIGRLPDVSIAEAIGRLPGIATQRTNGQASAINIRGLTQNLNLATLNGREQVSFNGDRSIEFETYPSELISGADIYKSPKASLIEGGIGGTIELKTIRPLNREGHTFNFNVRGSYNDRAGQIFDADPLGYRVSGSYIGELVDERVGLVLGYARLVQPDVSVRFVGFDFAGASQDFNGDGVNDNPSFGFEVEEQGGTDVRDTINGTLQFRVTERLDISIDAFASRFESPSFGRGIRVIGTQEVNGGNTTVANPVVLGQALVGGLFTRNVPAPTLPGGGFGLTFQNINDNQDDLDRNLTVGTNVKWTGDRLELRGDFTFSIGDSFFANEVSNILPIVSLTGGVPGISNNLPNTPVIASNQQVFIQLDGANLPTINFTDDFTDFSVQRLSNFGLFPFDNEERLFAFSGDGKYQLGGFFDSIEVGFRYSDRRAEQFRVSAQFGFGNDAGFFQFAGQPFTPIALNDSNSSVECFSGKFADNGFPCFLVIEDPVALAVANGVSVTLDQSAGFTRSDSFTVDERVIAGYIQANIDSQLFGLPLTGNIGVRIINTDQQSINQLTLENNPAADQVGINFTNFLPSLNLILALTDNDQLRFGASRALSRPTIFGLGGNVNVSVVPINTGGVPGFGLAGGGGNPGLQPFLANQGDISYEHYFEDGGIFTVAFFFKNLQSFITNVNNTAFDFEAAGLLPLVEQDPNFPQVQSFIGTFGGSDNAEGGRIWGFETAITKQFNFLPGFWKNFGVTASYAFTQSSVTFDAGNSGVTITAPLPGLSTHVINPTLYYEQGGFSNRISATYRSLFVSPQVGLNQQLPGTDEELTLSYQASYQFSDKGPLKGLTLLFQANNITDEPVATFFDSDVGNQTGTVQFFGRQFFFGASYTF